MTVKTKKLFISYRSSDHREVDYIARQLRSLKHDNNVKKFKTWQDKHDLKGGKSWWDGIIDAIIDCDIFVFHLTPDYLASKVCMAELHYAVERGRPIIPIVLDTAYYIKPSTKKPEIKFWDDVPDWLGKYHFIFYDEDDFLNRFEGAVAECERTGSRDIPARRPLNPDADSLHGTSYEVYATAVDYAQKVAFDDAKPLFRELLNRNDEDFADICHQWLTVIEAYQDLLDAKKHRAPRAVFQKKWRNYIAIFPLDFVDDLYPDSDKAVAIFDPNNLAKTPFWRKKKAQAPNHPPSVGNQASNSDVIAKYSTAPDAQNLYDPRQQAPVQNPIAKLPKQTVKPKTRPSSTSSLPSSEALLPKPFAWIEIPNKGYSIAKYPVTNAQFAKFIEAGGYNTERWWTKGGWHEKQKDSWTEPRYWKESKWNGDTQPVVGVSWYECVAFCLWLSDVTGEKIMLPTEDQWQYAAQGDDGRIYPWGNDWDCKRCNNSMKPCFSNVTTPVTQYEGKEKGDSPFGVVDMAGNVWQWCLTSYKEKTNDINTFAKWRMLCGGSWRGHEFNFRVTSRDTNTAHYRGGDWGFRVSRS